MKKFKICLDVPRYAEVLIYDQVGSEFIIEALGHNYSWTVLAVRGRRINLHPKVLCRVGLALMQCYRFGRRKGLIQSLRVVMELAELHAIQPKAVVTFVDNSARFNTLSRLYPNARFFAVQNGFRGIEVADMAHYLSATNFFCFGEDTKKRYEKNRCNIGNYIVGGSLKDGLYRERYPQQLDKKFDYCWISQFRPARFSRTLPGLAKTSILMLEFIYRLCQEENRSLVIAGSCKPNALAEEVGFLRRYVDFTQITFVPNDPVNFSSYQVIDQAEVAVTVNSTLGFEAFSRGAKVVFCNFSNEKYYDVPGASKEAPWVICDPNPTYSKFKAELQLVFETSQEKWVESTGKDAQHLVTTSDILLPQELLRRQVEETLSGKL